MKSLKNSLRLGSKEKQLLKNNKLINDDNQMTDVARLFQKKIGLDSGIFRRMVTSNDNIQENLDNMLNELDIS